jgi:hypothetical protein
MTQAEWMDAFRRGDPENIGQAVLDCLREAYTEMVATVDTPDIGELAPNGRTSPAYVLDFTVRVGQKMREYGLLYQLSDQTPEDSSDQH